MAQYSYFYYGVNKDGLHKVGQTKHLRQRRWKLAHSEGLTMVAIYKVKEYDKHSAAASKLVEALARLNLVKSGYENVGNDHFIPNLNNMVTVGKIINSTIKEANEKLNIDIVEI